MSPLAINLNVSSYNNLSMTRISKTFQNRILLLFVFYTKALEIPGSDFSLIN